MHEKSVWTDGLFSYPLIILAEKAMATHSSTLAWKIPWTEEHGRLQSMGSLRVGHDGSDLAAALVILDDPTINYWKCKGKV